ncbi:hypothetical protein LAZ67_20000416 [Cordylochernes scorpioides]|uniref:ATP-dependent DNA helicase n=1 Tax=Cordylochernes scorpioides TaxID=51811 RepID=A0ABY6LJH5_9ARAC|nr:hypothetical protein LAZ67_20000416 [Cordylochernes scorpioides]
MNAKDKKNKLRIIHWNACSLRNKRQQFTEFLNDHDIDIALISEPWLKPCHRMNIPNYNTVRNDRLSGQSGGTAIFIHKKYYCVPIQSTCLNLETTGITIKDKNRTTMNIYSCYKPPNTPLDPKDIYNIFKTNTPTILAGDLNCKNTTWGSFSTNPNGKILQKLTEANNNGYPRYRRRDDGQTLVVGTHEVDNRWVVPYNPYLLVRFNAHINVEVCASVKSVKYLLKYVYKGHDRAEVEVSVGGLDMESRAHDEIKNFLDARYVSAPEAMWRMFEYRLHAHSHTICRLAVHLANFQSVYFVEGSEEQALENASRRRTTLTAWFQLNCVNVSARSLLYGDIPSAYVFRQNQWSARVRGGALCIGHMCSVNPKDSERYHLRLLLLHVAGAQSFEDLRTVDDIVCSTFKEAAQRRGLLADDSEWDACLAEADLFQMPCELRQLFATILIYNNPTDPVLLWTKYKGYLSEDFSRATSDAAAEQMTLRELEFQLRENRLSCHHYGLPAPLTPLLDSGEDHLDVNAELQIGTEMYRSLTPDQKSIVDTIVDSLNVNPRCFFIDGPGGTGKTYVYNTLIHCVRAVGKIVIPLASTGIAATLLSGGQTVHSRFKLPIPLLENSVAAILANSSEAELIRRSSLIIWDEAPMAHYRALEIVDRFLKDIMHCDLAFGGKVVVLGGDFRQVLPVVPRASRAEIVAACIKQSKLWPLFVILRLTQNMRAGIDAQRFSQWLLKVGDGDLPTDQQGLISLPESCIFHGVDLVQEIFGSFYGDITALSQSVILTPKNTDSLEINEKVLDRLPNRSQCFLSVDSVECENVEEQNNYPTEFLNSLTPTGMPPHRLNLKIGAIVMLLRNLNPKQGLCNGTRMVIQRMRSHVLEAQILTGTKVGQTVLVPKISLAPSDTNLPFILKRRQFPLRLAFAMTINKAQGQTFARVGLLLQEPVFTHGQLYVAFSRVRTLNSIRVTLPKTPKNKDIYNITDICDMKCRVEAYRAPKGPGQCHRCQNFGHSKFECRETKFECRETPKCVKCGENHFTSECSKQKEVLPKCANCLGQHTANWRGCPHSTKKKKNKDIPSQKNPRPNAQKEPSKVPTNAKIPQTTGNKEKTCANQPKSIPLKTSKQSPIESAIEKALSDPKIIATIVRNVLATIGSQ